MGFVWFLNINTKTYHFRSPKKDCFTQLLHENNGGNVASKPKSLRFRLVQLVPFVAGDVISHVSIPHWLVVFEIILLLLRINQVDLAPRSLEPGDGPHSHPQDEPSDPPSWPILSFTPTPFTTSQSLLNIIALWTSHHRRLVTYRKQLGSACPVACYVYSYFFFYFILKLHVYFPMLLYFVTISPKRKFELRIKYLRYFWIFFFNEDTKLTRMTT